MKYFVIFFILMISACSSQPRSQYDLAINENDQMRKAQLVEFEKKRVEKELSSWQ